MEAGLYSSVISYYWSYTARGKLTNLIIQKERNKLVTHQQQGTMLNSQQRISSHTRLFGSCKEQINDTNKSLYFGTSKRNLKIMCDLQISFLCLVMIWPICIINLFFCMNRTNECTTKCFFLVKHYSFLSIRNYYISLLSDNKMARFLLLSL